MKVFVVTLGHTLACEGNIMDDGTGVSDLWDNTVSDQWDYTSDYDFTSTTSTTTSTISTSTSSAWESRPPLVQAAETQSARTSADSKLTEYRLTRY